MIFYTIHMICEAHPVMFDLFLVLQAPSKVRSAMQNAPQHKPIQPSAISKKRNTGSRTVAQAVHEASALGVTSFEDFIQSREANKTHDEAQHVSRHATVWSGGGYHDTRNQLGNTRTSRATKSMDNPWSCLAFVWQAQSSRVVPFHVFQNPNGPW